MDVDKIQIFWYYAYHFISWPAFLSESDGQGIVTKQKKKRHLNTHIVWKLRLKDSLDLTIYYMTFITAIGYKTYFLTLIYY